jgi:hypothetical protein
VSRAAIGAISSPFLNIRRHKVKNCVLLRRTELVRLPDRLKAIRRQAHRFQGFKWNHSSAITRCHLTHDSAVDAVEADCRLVDCHIIKRDYASDHAVAAGGPGGDGSQHYRVAVRARSVVCRPTNAN